MKIGTFRRIRMSDLMSNWKLWVAEMQDRADSMRAGGGDFLADVGVDDLRLIEELVGKSFDEWLEATGRRCDAAELVRVRILRADS